MNLRIPPIAILTVLVALGIPTAFPEPLEDSLEGLEHRIIDALLEQEEIYRYDREFEGMKMLPEGPFTGDVIRDVLRVSPDILAEALYLVPYSPKIRGVDLTLYNTLRRIRTISDVSYYSARKQKVQPLFDDVYRIASPDEKNPLPDDEVDSIPANESIYIHMDEVNFGSAYYRLDLAHRDGSLMLNLTNITAIRKIIKVVDKENMSLRLIVTPTDEGFLIYGLCMVDLSNKNFVENMLDPFSAFYRRLYALETWIYNTLHNTDRSPDFGDPLE